jgi:hypothetical protein
MEDERGSADVDQITSVEFYLNFTLMFHEYQVNKRNETK